MKMTAMAWFVALAITGCGEPLFFAEVSVPRVCVNSHLANLTVAETLRWERDFDFGSQIPALVEKGTTGSLRVLSFGISGSADLTGIASAEVKVTPSPGAQEATLLTYCKPASMTDPTTIVMTVASDVDLFPIVEEGKVHLAVDFVGQTPAAPWDADVQICLSAELMVDALQVL